MYLLRSLNVGDSGFNLFMSIGEKKRKDACFPVGLFLSYKEEDPEGVYKDCGEKFINYSAVRM